MVTTAYSGVTAAAVSRWMDEFGRGYQRLLDKWNPQVCNRWIATTVIATVYIVRVLYLQGFFIITYSLGIHLLNLWIGFLSPQVDPDVDEGATLPTRASDEFRPFVRRLPEFKFWYSFTLSFCIAFVLTFFSVLDIPVFWPILLIYWLILCYITLRRQILHMIKHKYLPFSWGKKTYGKMKAHASMVLADLQGSSSRERIYTYL